MKKILDKDKFKRIPWTVFVTIFVTVIAVLAVILAAVGAWQGGVLAVCALLLVVFVSVVIIRL